MQQFITIKARLIIYINVHYFHMNVAIYEQKYCAPKDWLVLESLSKHDRYYMLYLQTYRLFKFKGKRDTESQKVHNYTMGPKNKRTPANLLENIESKLVLPRHVKTNF